MTGRPQDRGSSEQRDDHDVSFLSLDTDGVVRFVDAELLALAGYDRGAILGRPFVELLPESEHDAFEAVFADALDGDGCSCAIPIRTTDDSTVSTTVEVRPETGPEGAVSRVHCRVDPRGSAPDLDAYERLIEVAPVGVFRTTTDGRVLWLNRRLASMLGYDSPRAAIAEHDELARDLYVDPVRREEFLERLSEHGAVEDFEYEARTASGRQRWFSMNARLLEETHDGTRVITGFTRDVTDRKRRNRQLAVLGRILRHNIRNALTVVQGQVELLRWERTDPQDVVGTILERTDSLLRQAEKEQALTELLRGPTDSVERDLVELVESAREDVLEIHPGATVTVDAPETATATVVSGFERALVELLDNAHRHGSSETSVTVRDRPDGVAIDIADEGPGMPEIERELLRGDVDETPLFHGAGVGLFLVRQLVVRSGGTIAVTDNEPRGTVVTISLPE
ncbi:PAS domain S-box protein [Halapricum desulfuricans]|uniref:histidine kinase n=1 Tax=Halapricum desulfuricans TaxID=2841257 RepID=A0A897MZL9_9EURY|nr:PAS domain S-box protein [Halapricum desulfuricans]QSG04543.1 REC domain [Halapricum desulfuricans]